MDCALTIGPFLRDFEYYGEPQELTLRWSQPLASLGRRQSLRGNFSAVDNLAVYATPPVSPATHRSQAFEPPLGQPRLGQPGGMEGDEQRRRHYEHANSPRGYAPDYGAPAANVSGLQHLRPTQVGENPEQFRNRQLLTTRTATSTPLAAGAGAAQDLGAFAYSQGQQYQTPQMQAPTFQYQTEYVQEPQRQRYPQYPSQMMYSVQQQPQSQSPYNLSQTQSSYDPVGHYQPRQTAAAEVLSSQFGVSSHYYNGGDNPNTSAPTVLPQGYQTASYQQPMQYQTPSALARSTLASPYPTIPSDFVQAAGGESTPVQETDPATENTNRLYHAIGETNDSTSRGMLIQAGSSLMQITDWLLTNAVRLGFTRDDYSMYAQRISLWDDFNNCWLALLQRQFDDTRSMLAGRPPMPPQSLLPLNTLERMGDNLVAHCDNLQRYALVDYQMGVSEEEIVDILKRCIDSLRPRNDSDSEPEDIPRSTQAPQRRRNR